MLNSVRLYPYRFIRRYTKVEFYENHLLQNKRSECSLSWSSCNFLGVIDPTQSEYDLEKSLGATKKRRPHPQRKICFNFHNFNYKTHSAYSVKPRQNLIDNHKRMFPCPSSQLPYHRIFSRSFQWNPYTAQFFWSRYKQETFIDYAMVLFSLGWFFREPCLFY